MLLFLLLVRLMIPLDNPLLNFSTPSSLSPFWLKKKNKVCRSPGYIKTKQQAASTASAVQRRQCWRGKEGRGASRKGGQPYLCPHSSPSADGFALPVPSL